MFERKDVKPLRKKLNMTQYELAMAIGDVTITTISAWENSTGDEKISKKYQRRLAELAKGSN
jgi:DNA-binding XRE family transcriptional regulator